MKKMNEKEVPQLIYSMHPHSASLEQSNMTLFQSSPVDRANRSKKEFMKFLKFLISLSTTSPVITYAKRKLPSTENMK